MVWEVLDKCLFGRQSTNYIFKASTEKLVASINVSQRLMRMSIGYLEPLVEQDVEGFSLSKLISQTLVKHN